ncbi:MAG TPA: hypothetical protein VG347_03500 [Verrucomicrobiae bacterium]|nr:hypothetical protein [Verrucomicrobiae bacterium]
MPGAIIADRLRLLLNSQKWNRPGVTDIITAATPVIPSGSDLQIELFITADGTVPFDFTNVASVTVALCLRASPLNNNIVFQQAIAVAGIATGATLAAFQGGAAAATGQQITLTLPNAVTQLGLTSSNTQYTLVVYATSTDATAKQQPLLVQDITSADAGLPVGNPALPVGFKLGNKMSFLCADGKTRDVTLALLNNGRWTIDVSQAGYNGAGQALFSLFCSDGNFRDLTVQLVQGEWTIDINQNGHA